MNNTTTKAKKIKTASLIALLAGGMAVGGMLYNSNSNDSPEQYSKKTEKEITDYSELSVEKLNFFIKHLDEFIEKTQKEIDSKELNPEERFEARRAYKEALEQRNMLQLELQKRQNTIVISGNTVR